MQADILRSKFLSFFKSKKHKVAESDSLVPKDDPTVLFTPAGMNQFKKQFLGHITDFTRAATSQRCLRTDDLDKVGKTTGHHTLFEMLGNFSFGDYFKKEAIAWAWEFLTKELSIKEDKLWVSVYKDDQEAYDIWKNTIKVPVDRIVKLGDKENFWPSDAKEKGPNGPCGPCSEIFFDFGKDKGCLRPECSPACSCGRFVEIWNLVFTQFNRKEGGILEPLPQKNIDTGMGLERLTAVMEGAPNNFETGLFQPIIKEILSVVKNPIPQEKEFVYAISDHIRAVIFSIFDGILPSNEGRGYVIRKLIRKCALHLRQLGVEKPFLYKLVPVVTEVMKEPYPDLSSRRENIAQIILAEERNFIAVLRSSDGLLQEKFAPLVKNPDPKISGVIAFQLYDTYGIPLELTLEWLNKNKISFSQGTFDKELIDQKNRSKVSSAMKGDVFGFKDFGSGLPATKFLGYGKNEVSAKVLKIIRCDKEVKRIAAGDQATIILDRTVFYAESGGQVADTGKLLKGKSIFEVLDTQKSGKYIIHIGKLKQGVIRKADSLICKVNLDRRLSIARNHTATHLLQAALRNILGPHVQQQGSLVTDEKLRFDFTHFKDISSDELDRIEEAVNSYILADNPLKVKEMSLTAAKKTGALAFFAEKYENKVRVVSIGDFSREFCGGTHLDSTGTIGIFKIIHEGSVASGVRRIEALTAKPALAYFKEKNALVNRIQAILNVPVERLTVELENKLAQIKELTKQVSAQKLNSAKSSVDELIQSAELIQGIKFITKAVDNQDMALLRSTVDMIRQKSPFSLVCLGSSKDGKALLVIGMTPDLVNKGLDASKLIGEIAASVGGSGGGRKDFAQAGGTKPENLNLAFEQLKSIISR